MTEPGHNQPEDLDLPSSSPQTGHPAVDDALAGLADLESAPLAEHHDRLAKAHEVLQEALDRADEDRSDDVRPG
ncbi:MAG: hypothetical protein ACJ72M_02215 [Propionibacteriaceae bacterium]|jgi:hypothetical protein